ncbi:MAG: hypothetical protein NTZ16_16350 [Verrucomicrobia bacterium]|nr:hypothetical protein [Verrucomicrobiota bacterium]
MNDLISRLHNVKLKGYDNFAIYKDADITIEPVKISDMSPCQNYVLNPIVNHITTMFKCASFIFDLQEGLMIEWCGTVVPFLPPIIEKQTINRQEKLIVMDGIHRVFTAKSLGFESVSCVMVNKIKYPYYALPTENGWDGVVRLDAMDESFNKKVYVDPLDYKALFRLINDEFPGIQTRR